MATLEEGGDCNHQGSVSAEKGLIGVSRPIVLSSLSFGNEVFTDSWLIGKWGKHVCFIFRKTLSPSGSAASAID